MAITSQYQGGVVNRRGRERSEIVQDNGQVRGIYMYLMVVLVPVPT